VNDHPDLVRRSPVILRADARRVIARPFLPGHELPSKGISRADSVVERLVSMSETDVETTLAATLSAHAGRHADLRGSFKEHYQIVAHRIPSVAGISSDRADLIGAYLTHEYAIEAAALFNPSIAAHPDQSGLAPGELRFVMTARAVGEGHVSSLELRTGVLAGNDVVRLDAARTRLTTGRMTQSRMPTEFLREALDEAGDAVTAQGVLGRLPEQFSAQELDDVLASSEQDSPRRGHDGLLERVRRMAASSYELTFPTTSDLSERVIFPSVGAESHGIEDARLVRFVDDDGSIRYYATYTAYDGSGVAPHLLCTTDFKTFSMRPQLGPAAKNKGMALFPRRIGGRFWSLSRWDRESISIASSLDLLRWERPVTVLRPSRPWDLIQLGPCSSPLETPQGWLVITHGVGPMRTYALGAMLLDLDDPTIVRGVLSEPLMTTDPGERDGYVPNVLYSCGGLIHGEDLVLPYGCADSSIRFAFIDLEWLLARLLERP
jgi:predicted GH43/DUF377 family glycosyl hydrolase